MSNCLICNHQFNHFVDFGNMPIANAFSKNESSKDEYTFRMKVGFCKNCLMVQLIDQPDRERMFHENYAFFSSTSNFMKEHFSSLASSIISNQNLNKDSFILEIGCNDGIFLENFVSDGIPCLGIEPSENVAKVARSKGIEVISDFFDETIAKKLLSNYKKADAIVSANVMCHIPYIHSIFEGVKALLKSNGIFVFEDPYLGEVIDKTSFDQIYDEHVFLFSALSVRKLAYLHELELIDVEYQITHGGSMRYSLAHKGSKQITKNVQKIINKEMQIGLNEASSYNGFANKIDKIKINLINLLTELKNKNKKVVGYGATSKSTTVINYFGITPQLLECIYDTTPIKQNTFSPGANIPILPYDDFRKSDPDYVLLFAWNHATEIMKKEQSYMDNDKYWITYIPQVMIHK